MTPGPRCGLCRPRPSSGGADGPQLWQKACRHSATGALWPWTGPMSSSHVVCTRPGRPPSRRRNCSAMKRRARATAALALFGLSEVTKILPARPGACARGCWRWGLRAGRGPVLAPAQPCTFADGPGRIEVPASANHPTVGSVKGLRILFSIGIAPAFQLRGATGHTVGARRFERGQFVVVT